MRTFVVCCLLLLALPFAASAQSLNDAAQAYVRLALDLGVHDPDWVDAYYGPPEWRADAARTKKPLATIQAEARAVLAGVEATKPDADRVAALRRTYLIAQLRALIARADMLAGSKLPFEDEAYALYGLTPARHDDAFFAAALADLERELPGDGTLQQRLDAYRKRFTIPKDKLDEVLRVAMAECRARTLAHVTLPPEESFTIEYVTNKPWSGYNWYQGNYRSVIQINTDLPIPIQRAVDLACHEGYPGHHVYNVLLEKNLVRGRGWVEYSIYPLYSPQSLVAEGTGNYGIEIAFPGDERMRFERDRLYPLAGLDPGEAERYQRVLRITARLGYSAMEAARRMLDGAMTREEAASWLERYGTYGPKSAKQQLDFATRYRSYVLNYTAGQDAAKAYVESAPPAERAKVFFDLISTPRLLLEPREVWGRRYDVVELAPGVFTMIWREVIAGPVAIGNSTFIVNDDDVVVVDASFLPSMAKALVAEIRKKTSKPVRYIVLTHFHEDHVAGVQVLRDEWPDAEVIAHPDTRRDLLENEAVRFQKANDARQVSIDELAAKKDRTEREERVLGWMRKFQAEIASVRFQAPTMLVPDSLTLRRGSRDIVIRHLGLGNTRGDLVVQLPKERIAITGDLAILPLQFALGSYIGPWIETLDRVAALPADTWVPGHGPLQHDAAYIRNVRDVLRTIHSRVAAGILQGKTLEELKKTIDVPEYRKAAGAEAGVAKEWYDDYFLAPAIERAYEELKR